VVLERPPIAFFPSQLAVFHSGEILMSGLEYQPGYKAATAIYDPTGHVVKQLVLDGDYDGVLCYRPRPLLHFFRPTQLTHRRGGAEVTDHNC
jgi:hypothetical protein